MLVANKMLFKNSKWWIKFVSENVTYIRLSSINVTGMVWSRFPWQTPWPKSHRRYFGLLRHKPQDKKKWTKSFNSKRFNLCMKFNHEYNNKYEIRTYCTENSIDVTNVAFWRFWRFTMAFAISVIPSITLEKKLVFYKIDILRGHVLIYQIIISDSRIACLYLRNNLRPFPATQI